MEKNNKPLLAEQYASQPGAPTPKVRVKSQEEKTFEQLQAKIMSLESYINEQGGEILKLRRDISRLKDDINSITSTLRRG